MKFLQEKDEIKADLEREKLKIEHEKLQLEKEKFRLEKEERIANINSNVDRMTQQRQMMEILLHMLSNRNTNE